MGSIGLDPHKRESQVCILTDEGELIERRFATTPHRSAAVFGERPRARIMFEASTESEWVARYLEALGRFEQRDGAHPAVRGDVLIHRACASSR